MPELTLQVEENRRDIAEIKASLSAIEARTPLIKEYQEAVKDALKEIKADIANMDKEIKIVTANFNRGAGVFAGVILVLGVFSGELVNWIKTLMRSS